MYKINMIMGNLNSSLRDYFKYHLAAILNLNAEVFSFDATARNTEIQISEEQWKQIRDLDISFETIAKDINGLVYFSLINYVIDFFNIIKPDEQ